MNLLQLRYFTAVARLENMSRAADYLHVSQSALSKNIAKLEEEIGTPLFDRSGKRVELNSAGALFLECANDTLEKMDETLEKVRQLATGSGKKLKIGMSGTCELLMKCMIDFRKKYPDVQFDIRTDFEALPHPDINDYDVIVYPDLIRFEKYSGYPLYEERYYLAVPDGHPLAVTETANAKALEGTNIVFLRRGETNAEHPQSVCAALGIRFSAQYYTDSREIHRRMIASGTAIGFVPEGEAGPYRTAAGIRLLPFTDKRFDRKMMICFRRDKHLTDIGMCFKKYLGEQLKLPF